MGRYLDGVPGASEGRCVAEVQVVEIIDHHFAKHCNCGNIDSFRDLSITVPDDLRTKQSASRAISRDSHREFARSRVVEFAVESRRADVSGSKPASLASPSRRPERAAAS